MSMKEHYNTNNVPLRNRDFGTKVLDMKGRIKLRLTQLASCKIWGQQLVKTRKYMEWGKPTGVFLKTNTSVTQVTSSSPASDFSCIWVSSAEWSQIMPWQFPKSNAFGVLLLHIQSSSTPWSQFSPHAFTDQNTGSSVLKSPFKQ